MTRVFVTGMECDVSNRFHPFIEERECLGYEERGGHEYARIERGAPWTAGAADAVPVERVHETIEAAQAFVLALVKRRRATMAREMKRLALVERDGAKVRRMK